jgi:hypothetical protein
MKKILPIKFIILLCCTVLSCEEELPRFANYESYLFSTVDEDGGTWTPVLLASPDQVLIDEPDDVSSPVYQEELTELKSVTSNLSSQQRKAVTYWTNNPVLRWNEIALELIAKYNLIPGPNPDGTYTLPNPANPDGPPPFPFAHPPYAARALAYLSVAQYDGLISAWHYKYLYNRESPYEVDSSIPVAYIKNNIPSYPADGAVIAAASRDILSAMFPLEKDYLAERAEEHMQSLMWAGMHVESDITAGEYLGEEVAKVGLARAGNDGMKKAQCPKPVSDSIAASAFARYGWQWENLEIPKRPVGLTPLYGQVQMWSIDNVEDVRPGPPPAIGSPEYEEDVKLLKDMAKNRTEERRRSANFWQDGLGTYTPPGHWNRFAKEFLIKYNISPLRSARTFAYLNMAMMDGGISCWDAKYYYHYPRPIQTISGFTTIAGTPNFPSYTSGHSVFSAAGAEVLAYIFPQEAQRVRAWALEAAMSRVYGGIHWSFDATVGTQQGIDVASYTVARAMDDGAD